MRVPFPSDIEEVNPTDFDVLRCLHASGPLWKMEITRRINEHRGNGRLLDVKPSITKQAVAKRVERLHELDLLETTIIDADGLPEDTQLNREFIIGYRLSEKGTEALQRCTRCIVRDAIHHAIGNGTAVGDLAGIDDHLDRYFALNGGAPGGDPVLAFVREEALDQ